MVSFWTVPLDQIRILIELPHSFEAVIEEPPECLARKEKPLVDEFHRLAGCFQQQLPMDS